jgi:hypothetical protein
MTMKINLWYILKVWCSIGKSCQISIYWVLYRGTKDISSFKELVMPKIVVICSICNLAVELLWGHRDQAFFRWFVLIVNKLAEFHYNVRTCWLGWNNSSTSATVADFLLVAPVRYMLRTFTKKFWTCQLKLIILNSLKRFSFPFTVFFFNLAYK